MSQITLEYLNQLEKEARSQLSARMVANLESQATHELTPQQIIQINSQINKIPMANFVGYLLYGIINSQNVSKLTSMSPERHDIAMAFINKANGIMPSEQHIAPEIVQEPRQPEIVQEPRQPEIVQEPRQPEIVQEPRQPAIVQEPRQDIRPVKEAVSAQVVEPANNRPLDVHQPAAIHTDVCLLGTPLETKAFWAFIVATQKKRKDIQSCNAQVLTTELTASKITDNRNALLTMNDLDANALAQLSPERKKQIIFVLDATTDSVNYNQIASQTDDAGNIRNYSIHKTVSQAALIKQLFLLLSSTEGRQFLHGTTTLSIVFTKAGVIGAPGQRDHECLRRFKMMHHDDINPLIQLCHDHGINASTNGQPMLFTFENGHSFGNVTPSQSETEKLVEMLKGNTAIIEN